MAYIAQRFVIADSPADAVDCVGTNRRWEFRNKAAADAKLVSFQTLGMLTAARVYGVEMRVDDGVREATEATA